MFFQDMEVDTLMVETLCPQSQHHPEDPMVIRGDPSVLVEDPVGAITFSMEEEDMDKAASVEVIA